MPIVTQKHLFIFSEIDAAPDIRGVYALYDVRGNVTYYGSSLVSVRDRLLSHKGGYEGPCTRAAYYFNYEYSLNPLGRERQLLESHRLVYGRLPACNAVIP